MKNNIFILLLFLFFTLEAISLEIDEKLPLRILKVSRSSKTILINRGLEDGLVNNNHAKFFLTKGVVARGVVVKTSPTRSVWSLYRVIDSNEIKPDKVMNLKISTPVKLSEDASKMLSQEDVPQYNRGRIKYYNDTTIPYYQGRVAPVYKGEPVPQDMMRGIPVGQGGMDIDQQELDALESGDPQPERQMEKRVEKEGSPKTNPFSMKAWKAPRHSYKNMDRWEVNTSFSFNSLSSTVETSGGSSSSSSGDISLTDFNLGGALFFPKSKGWFYNIALGGLIHKASQSSTDINGTSVDIDVLEYGAYLDWHLDDPFKTQTLAWYLTAGFAVGSVEDSSSGATSTSSVSGTSSSLHLGGGAKYLAHNGWGFKAQIDFYQRGEVYGFDDGTETTRTLSGPRFLMGAFMRF